MSDLDTHAKAGIEAINDNRLNDAIEHLTKALSIDESRPDLNNALGMTYLRRGDAANGLPYLEAAVQLAEPFDAPEHQEMKQHFHMGLASTYQVLDRVADALRVLTHAGKTWPNHLESKLQLGQLLLQSCQLDQGVATYRAVADNTDFDEEIRTPAKAVVGAIEAFLESDLETDMFLRAHQQSYKDYFDEVSKEQVSQGWFAEATRMKRGPNNEPLPIIAEGARPYAMERVDLVNPEDGTAAGIYSEQEPMIVALNGLEPLAQVSIAFPWKSRDYPIWISSRCPWHWLTVLVQFEASDTENALINRLDPTIGEWYLAGFNGDFGERDSGRFHYITDPEVLGNNAVSYTIDLGRSRYDAITALLNRLSVLHDTHPIARLVFGQAKLPD